LARSQLGPAGPEQGSFLNCYSIDGVGGRVGSYLVLLVKLPDYYLSIAKFKCI